VKRLIQVFLILTFLLAGGYAGAWYYGCMRLEQRLAQRDVNFSLGPNSEVTVSLKLDRGGVRFVGALQGEVGVEFDLRSVSSQSSVKLAGQHEVQTSTATITPAGEPLHYRVSVPMWGNSLTITADPFKDARYVMKVGDRTASLLLSGERYAAAVVFRSAALAYQREMQVIKLLAQPRRIADELAGLQISGVSTLRTEDNGSEIISGAISGGGIHWEIDAKEMLKVRSDLDCDFKYGSAFGKWLEMLPTQSSTPEDAQVAASMEVVRKVQAGLLEGGNFIMKGGFEVTLPASRLGLRENAPPGDTGFPVPPFTVLFDRFSFRLPFVFSRLMELNGSVQFLQGDGKPLLVDLRQRVAPLDIKRALEAFVKQDLYFSALKEARIDSERVTASSLRSLREVLSNQGLYVTIYSLYRSLADLYFAQAASNEMHLAVKTPSGGASLFELLGAQGKLRATAMLDSGVGIELNGERDGPDGWSSQVKVFKLVHIVRQLREPITVFAVRSGLATFLEPDQSTTSEQPVSDQEKEVLAFLFSEPLFDKIVAAVERIVQRVDSSPDSPEEIAVSIAQKGSAVTVNGKSTPEFLQEVTGLLQNEAQQLLREVLPQLEKVRQVKGGGAEQGQGLPPPPPSPPPSQLQDGSQQMEQEEQLHAVQ
jgi:hypothetical protein